MGSTDGQVSPQPTTAYGAHAKKRKAGDDAEEAVSPVPVVGPFGMLTSTAHGREPDALRQARVDLAACYRMLDRLGLNEGIDNHLTVMVARRRGDGF